MPNEDKKNIKIQLWRKKSMKHPFIINTDLECLLKEMSNCYNNPEKPSITKENEHEASGYSLFTHCSFDSRKNRLHYYRDKYRMEHLKEHATKIINYEKK